MSEGTVIPNAMNGIIQSFTRVSDSEAIVSFTVVTDPARLDQVRLYDAYNLELTSTMDAQPSEPVPAP